MPILKRRLSDGMNSTVTMGQPIAFTHRKQAILSHCNESHSWPLSMPCVCSPSASFWSWVMWPSSVSIVSSLCSSAFTVASRVCFCSWMVAFRAFVLFMHPLLTLLMVILSAWMVWSWASTFWSSSSDLRTFMLQCSSAQVGRTTSRNIKLAVANWGMV